MRLSSTHLPEVRVEAPEGTPRWAPFVLGPMAGYRCFDDFDRAAGAALELPWGTHDASAAGAPTLDFVANADGGHYQLKLATTNEVETIGLYHLDQLMFDVAKNPIFVARLKIEPDVTGAGGQLAATDKIVIGLASAHNGTLDSIATNAWFLLTGGNRNIYVESDDGTTDDDDNDTGVDWASNSFIDFKIDMSNLGAVKFYVDEACVAILSMAAASGNVQPYITVQKAAAANFDHRVTVDFVDVHCDR
jgi:hypothetical protein